MEAPSVNKAKIMPELSELRMIRSGAKIRVAKRISTWVVIISEYGINQATFIELKLYSGQLLTWSRNAHQSKN